MDGLIYKLIFPNSKLYVGQTIQGANKRFRQHIGDAFNQNSTSYNTKISRAIRKHGISKDMAINIIVIEILDKMNKDMLNDAEINYIKELCAVQNGYNSTNGGTGTRGWRHTAGAKKKISARSKMMSGEKSANNKATDNDVKNIRAMFLKKISVTNIHREFEVLSYNAIQDIVKNRTWKDSQYSLSISNTDFNKLNKTRVKQIRQKYLSGSCTINDLSIEYSTAKSNIHKIISNESWIDKKYDKRLKDIVSRSNIKSAAKLKTEDAINIRSLANSGDSTKSLAKKYNVSIGAISCIITNKTWRQR